MFINTSFVRIVVNDVTYIAQGPLNTARFSCAFKANDLDYL